MLYVLESLTKSMLFYFLKCKICILEEQAIINIIRNNSLIKQEEIANMINRSLLKIKLKYNIDRIGCLLMLFKIYNVCYIFFML